jgi:hypothetical protein
MIDVATLTGACIVALGEYCAGVFTNSDDLANKLKVKYLHPSINHHKHQIKRLVSNIGKWKRMP